MYKGMSQGRESLQLCLRVAISFMSLTREGFWGFWCRGWYILGEVGSGSRDRFVGPAPGFPEFHGSMNLFQPKLVHSNILCGMASAVFPKYPPFITGKLSPAISWGC